MCVWGGCYCQGWAHLVHREVTYRGALVLAHVPRVKVELLDSGPGFDPAGKGEEMAARGGGGKERRLTSKQHVGQAKIEGESGARERERPHSLEWSQRRRIAGTNQSQHSHSHSTVTAQSQHESGVRVGGRRPGQGGSTGRLTGSVAPVPIWTSTTRSACVRTGLRSPPAWYGCRPSAPGST